MLSVENECLRVRVIDFENHHWMKTGADRDTTTLGTAGYAAPEQWGFSASDASTDIYAAGILLCRLLTGEGREAVERIEDETLRYIVKRCTRMEKEERYRNVHALISDLRRAYQPYMEYQEKSSQGMGDSFWQFMEEICNIDYANTFLEKPELRKEPVYMVLMISMIIGTIVLLINCGWVIVAYIPYSMIVSLYFKRRLEKSKFYYPYKQNFIELRENLHMNLIKNGIRFVNVDEEHLTVKIKKRVYYVTADISGQVINIQADWKDKMPGIKKLFQMMDDVGLIVYLFQHMYII